MRNEGLVSVLDLGSTKAVCLVAREGQKGGVEPVAVAHVPLSGWRRGNVEDGDAMAVGIADVVAKVERSIEGEIGPMVVSLSGPSIEARSAQGFVEIIPEGRAVTRDDVLKVMNHSRQMVLPGDLEQIQAIPREFRVNGERGIHRPIGMPASRLEVLNYLIVGPSRQLNALEGVLRAAGVRLDSLVLGPLASGLGVLNAKDADQGCAVLDIGADQSSLGIFVNGAIASHATLPVGSARITSDLAMLLKASKDEAERLKLRYGSALARGVDAEEQIDVLQQGADHARPMQRRVFCEIIESRAREIAKMAVDVIDGSDLRSELKGGLVLTGGGSQLPGLEELMDKEINLGRTRTLSPRVEGQLRHHAQRPDFAAAVGLAHFALDRDEDELATASGSGSWRNRIRTLWTLLGGSR